MNYPLRTIQEDGDAVIILDQTQLPATTAFIRISTLAQSAAAIRTMQVRGAPLIGTMAAYGVALGLAEDHPLDEIISTLAATRPTAVNLHWALQRMRTALTPYAAAAQPQQAWLEARAIAAEDAASNAAIARHGLQLLRGLARPGEALQLMTHCNAGWLATVAHGTALAPLYAAHAEGLKLHVWVSETRPRNQGLLTCWELAQADIAHSLIVDNAAGLLMQQGKLDAVIVGADRIAANGDTANKIGTYLKALAAQAHGVPFYVAAPLSSVDPEAADGGEIPIEIRAGSEVDVSGTAVHNPAFDITPAALIKGYITERGVLRAHELTGVRA